MTTPVINVNQNPIQGVNAQPSQPGVQPNPTPLSLSVSPAAVHLPATVAGIAPYQGQVTFTDNGSQPVAVTFSTEHLTGCAVHGQVPWLHVQTPWGTDSLVLQPHQPAQVGFTVDGGASGQAAILASASSRGQGNIHLAGAVGERVSASGSTHATCAVAAPPAPTGSFPWLALALPLLALLALTVWALRRQRANRI